MLLFVAHLGVTMLKNRIQLQNTKQDAGHGITEISRTAE
jgi:hypothetical protein